MTDKDIEETPAEAEEISEEIEIEETSAENEETPAENEETLTEITEERLEQEGELTAASAEKEYAQLIADEGSHVSEDTEGDSGTEGEGGEEGEDGAEEKKDEDTTPRARGLYRYVKISLPTLNKLIVVLCALLVICLIYGMSDRGYMVDFDSQGGTPVESEKLMYSDKVIPPEIPYREGYTFTGWYTNADCTQEWDLDTGLVGGPMTLYAGWEKNDE